MRLIITGRHVAVSPALRRYIEERMTRLERCAPRLGDVQVVVTVEKYRHTAEVVFRHNGRTIQGKTSTTEMYASIDQLVDKVLRQVRKRKDQLVDHKPRASRRAIRRVPAEVEPPPAVRTVRPALKLLPMEEALDQLGEAPNSLLVFVNAQTHRVQVLHRLPTGLPELVDPQPL